MTTATVLSVLGGLITLILAILKIVSTRRSDEQIRRDKLAEAELHETQTAMDAVDAQLDVKRVQSPDSLQ